MTTSVRTEEDRMQQIRKLTEVSRALTYAATLDEVFRLTVTRAADLFAAEKALLLVTKDDGFLALRASHGVDAAFAKSFREPMSEGLVPRIAALLNTPPERFLGVPLVVAGEIKGILVVIRPAASTGEEQDEWLLSALGDQAAVALEKSRLGEIGEFREQLIGIVGHDLRNPLNTICLGAHALLAHQGLGERETEVARRIARSAQVAVRLIDQLLDLTQSRLGGGIPIDLSRVDLRTILRQVLEETQMAHPERRVDVDMNGDLNGVWDRDRLYQLFANLLGNAVKHGQPRSAIELRVDGGDLEVLIEITNRGEPIAPDLLPHIFDAFRKGRGLQPLGNHGSEPGLGLGLFIAQQIAHAHGGSIAAQSSADGGTTFRIRLPRRRAAAAVAAA